MQKPAEEDVSLAPVEIESLMESLTAAAVARRILQKVELALSSAQKVASDLQLTLSENHATAEK